MLVKLAGSVAAVTASTLLVWALEQFAPTLSLGVIYVFAVLPVAITWGLRWSLPVAVASMLAFNWFFLPPRHTFTLSDSRELVRARRLLRDRCRGQRACRARSRRRAADAEQRERESSLLAEIADAPARRPAARGGARLGRRTGRGGARVERAEIELGPPRRRGRATLRSRSRSTAVRSARSTRRPDADPNLGVRQPVSAGAGRAARRGVRPEPARAGGARGGDAAPERPREDRAAPCRLPRPPLAPDRDHDRDRRAAQRDARLQRRRPPRAARHDRRRCGAARPGSSATCSISRGSRPAARSPTPRSGRSTSSSARRSPSCPGSDRIDVAGESAARQRRRGADPARAREPVENALKFSPPEARVHVRITATRQEAIVRIVDQGPGLDDRGARAGLRAVLPQPAADSARAPASGSRSRAGSRRRTAAASGPSRGRARERRSRSRCRSSRCRRSCPHETAHPRRRRRAADPARARDDAARRRATRSTPPTRPQAALAAAAAQPPAAVILDLVLPDGSGTDVCRELRTWTRRAGDRALRGR